MHLGYANDVTSGAHQLGAREVSACVCVEPDGTHIEQNRQFTGPHRPINVRYELTPVAIRKLGRTVEQPFNQTDVLAILWLYRQLFHIRSSSAIKYKV